MLVVAHHRVSLHKNAYGSTAFNNGYETVVFKARISEGANVVQPSLKSGSPEN